MFRALLLLGAFGLILAGCEDSGDGGTAAPQVAVKAASSTCSSGNCGGAADGTYPALIAWSSATCAQITADIENVQISVLSEGSSTCTSGTCTFSSGNYIDEETESPATQMPEADTTALAWYDLNNNSDTVDSPDSGDAVCCQESNDDDATLVDGDCTDIP